MGKKLEGQTRKSVGYNQNCRSLRVSGISGQMKANILAECLCLFHIITIFFWLLMTRKAGITSFVTHRDKWCCSSAWLDKSPETSFPKLLALESDLEMISIEKTIQFSHIFLLCININAWSPGVNDNSYCLICQTKADNMSVTGRIILPQRGPLLVVKNPPANAGDIRDPGSSLDLGDPLEEGMATHSSILVWRIPWTKEPGGLWSIGWQRDRHNWSDGAHTQRGPHPNPQNLWTCYPTWQHVTQRKWLRICMGFGKGLSILDYVDRANLITWIINSRELSPAGLREEIGKGGTTSMSEKGCCQLWKWRKQITAEECRWLLDAGNGLQFTSCRKTGLSGSPPQETEFRQYSEWAMERIFL